MAPFTTSLLLLDPPLHHFLPCFGNIAQFFRKEILSEKQPVWLLGYTSGDFNMVLDLPIDQNRKGGGIPKLCNVPIWGRNKSWLFQRKPHQCPSTEGCSVCRPVSRLEFMPHHGGILISPNLIYNGAVVRPKQK